MNGTKIEFESIKSLKAFLKEKYNYTPCNTTFTKLLEEGKNGIPYKPFHKNKYKNLEGMKIYKLNDDVETNRDECSDVGLEMGSNSKDEAQ